MNHTVYEIFTQAADTNADRPWLSVTPETASAYGIEAGDITYGAARHAVERLRSQYAEAGYQTGQRVGLLLENRPIFFLHWFALNALGVSIVPLNPDLRVIELAYVISHSEVVAIVAIPSRHAALREAAGRDIPITAPDALPAPLLRTGVDTNSSSPSSGPFPPSSAPDPPSSGPFPPPSAPNPPSSAPSPPSSWPGLSGPPPQAPASTVGPDEPGHDGPEDGSFSIFAPSTATSSAEIEAALLYTSGTTGRPKGCVLPNSYFLTAGRWYANLDGLGTMRTASECMLTPLPLFHMNALACSAMAMLMTGGCLIPLDRFHPRSWWRTVRDSRATIIHYLGVMPAILMADPPAPEDREHTVRFGFGAGVDAKLHAPFEQRFGFPLIEAWAMTETGAGAVIAANHEPRHIGTYCFGRPTPDIETRIVHEDGTEAEQGELLVRHAGPDPRQGFFREYLKDPDATEEAWAGGWFHSGDVVRRGPDGSLHFVDRRKNVIRRSGENIAAVEVESALRQHPAITAVAVAPVPDPVRGEEVFACIVTQSPPSAALASEITAWCVERLAYYKAPGFIAFASELPLTSTQKIQRGELRALVASLTATAHDTRALKRRPA